MFLFEVLAMTKQLQLSTFFMTLSCAELRWNELIPVIANLNGENLERMILITCTFLIDAVIFN